MTVIWAILRGRAFFLVKKPQKKRFRDDGRTYSTYEEFQNRWKVRA